MSGDAARANMTPGMQVTPNVCLVRPLRAGGMGAVWLARDTSLNREVVVKFILGGVDASPAAKKRFEREATAAAAVKSPHVVQMHAHGVTDDDIPFIVMEHLEGKDLGAVLAERGPLPPHEVVTIVSQVAKALGKAHAAGLLHRDVKPDNIFWCEGEDDEIFVKLLDFGIAKSADQQHQESTLDGGTKTGQVVGTPFYMSPEQVTAQKNIDARSDLWSLGIVTFELLTGVRPYDGPSFGALAVKIATGEPLKASSIRPELGEGFDRWFAQACARDPKDRFPSARAMADALRTALGMSLVPSTGRRGMDSGETSGERSLSPARLGDSQPRDPAPSFGLASTINDVATPDPAAAAKAVDTTPSSRIAAPGKGPPKIALGAAALAFLCGIALFVGTRSDRPTSVDTTTKTRPPVILKPPVSVAPAEASEVPLADVSTPAASASAPAVASSEPVADAGRVAQPKAHPVAPSYVVPRATATAPIARSAAPPPPSASAVVPAVPPAPTSIDPY